MARKRTAERDGQVAQGLAALEQAVATLLNNQAQFIGHIARIDERLANIERLLMEHHQILLGLPKAIRQEIGFKPRG